MVYAKNVLECLSEICFEFNYERKVSDCVNDLKFSLRVGRTATLGAVAMGRAVSCQ